MKTKVLSLASSIDPDALLFGGATWFFLFGYQLGFYYYYQLVGSQVISSQRHVFSYYSGLIGDGVILPMLNALVFLLLREIGARLTVRKLTLSLALGLAVTTLLHLAQASLALTNWAMPSPYYWSGIGRFHFFVMWFEFAFLLFTLNEILQNLGEVTSSRRKTTLLGLVWLLIGLFLISFAADYAAILGV